MNIILKRFSSLLLLLFGVFGYFLAVAQTTSLNFTSSSSQVQLIELYTSEGCSSCPPADRWLTSLSDHPGLWKDFVPMAFHVDYWNYIGWVDPFASQENSQRQRLYARQYKEPTVYTPGVRKAGQEWRRWRTAPDPAASKPQQAGVLSFAVSGQQYVAKYQADPSAGQQNADLKLTVALLGSDLSSVVTRGENHGKTLEHDFVVLATSQTEANAKGEWTGRIPSSLINAPRLSVAAWLSKDDSLTPIQATGGYLN